MWVFLCVCLCVCVCVCVCESIMVYCMFNVSYEILWKLTALKELVALKMVS